MTLKQYNLERHAEKLRKQINNWDREDADEMRDLLIEFQRAYDKLEREGVTISEIDGSDLPSEEFPEGFDTTGYWALDKNGYAVCGISWEEHELSVEKIE